MIDWTTIKATAKSVIGDLTGAEVRWWDEAEGTTFAPLETPIIYLRVSALRQIGTPEELREDNGASDQTVVVGAQKVFTLSLRAENFDQDIAGGHAGALLETLKTRLKRSSTIERLRRVFAVQEILGSNWFNYINQDRQVSVYTLDLMCATADNDVDATSGAGGFIAEVQVASDQLYDIDGTPVATQVNMDIKP